MTCAECKDLLLDLAYGELEPARAGEVLLHLAGCAECSAEKAQLEHTRAMMAPAVSPSVPGAMEEPGPAFDGPILTAAREAAAALGQRSSAQARHADANVQAAVIPLASARGAGEPPMSRLAEASRARRRASWVRATLVGSVVAAAALALVVSTKHPEHALGEPPRSAEEQAPVADAQEHAAPKATPVALLAPPQAQAPAQPSAPSRDAREAPAKAPAPPPPKMERRFAPPPSGWKDKPESVPSIAAQLGALAGARDGARGVSGLSSGGGGTAMGIGGLGVRGEAEEKSPAHAKKKARKEAEKTQASAGESSAQDSPTAWEAPPPAAPAPAVPVAAEPRAADLGPADDSSTLERESRSAAPGKVARDRVAAAPSAIGASNGLAAKASLGAPASASSTATLEAQAQAAQNAGRLTEAARLFRAAARSRESDGDTSSAARDLSLAISCYASAGRLAEAREARAALAAISPSQDDALSQADAEISAHEARAASPRAAPAAAAPPPSAVDSKEVQPADETAAPARPK